MFVSLMGYVFISILKEKKTTLRSRFKRYFVSKMKQDEAVNQTILKFKEAMFMILKAIIMNFRYIALFLSLLASLSTVNLLNAFLLFLTLQFAWNNKNDDKRWIYFVYYNTLFIPILYFSVLIPQSVQTFNVEVISILGVHSGNEKVYSVKMGLHYSASVACSIYLFLNEYLPSIRKQNLENKNLKK